MISQPDLKNYLKKKLVNKDTPSPTDTTDRQNNKIKNDVWLTVYGTG